MRECGEDIPLLIHHFTTQYPLEISLRFTQKSIDILVAHPWEGNP